jgi:hypothetical protein
MRFTGSHSPLRQCHVASPNNFAGAARPVPKGSEPPPAARQLRSTRGRADIRAQAGSSQDQPSPGLGAGLRLPLRQGESQAICFAESTPSRPTAPSPTTTTVEPGFTLAAVAANQPVPIGKRQQALDHVARWNIRRLNAPTLRSSPPALPKRLIQKISLPRRRNDRAHDCVAKDPMSMTDATALRIARGTWRQPAASSIDACFTRYSSR